MREALARLINPVAWECREPIPDVFSIPEVQAQYVEFFWEGVRERRQPSLDAADRILAAFDVVAQP